MIINTGIDQDQPVIRGDDESAITLTDIDKVDLQQSLLLQLTAPDPILPRSGREP